MKNLKPWDNENPASAGNPQSAAMFENIVSYLEREYLKMTGEKGNYGKTVIEIVWDNSIVKGLNLKSEETLRG